MSIKFSLVFLFFLIFAETLGQSSENDFVALRVYRIPQKRFLDQPLRVRARRYSYDRNCFFSPVQCNLLWHKQLRQFSDEQE
ncbi:unnamed protein product, partial [Mesorhabditis belari]|uniref:Secreted protein n=1 Tax=Mesorhabditis belari TaxID=2138241 RepID=A0AAF3EQY0_9BILA